MNQNLAAVQILSSFGVNAEYCTTNIEGTHQKPAGYVYAWVVGPEHMLYIGQGKYRRVFREHNNLGCTPSEADKYYLMCCKEWPEMWESRFIQFASLFGVPMSNKAAMFNREEIIKCRKAVSKAVSKEEQDTIIRRETGFRAGAPEGVMFEKFICDIYGKTRECMREELPEEYGYVHPKKGIHVKPPVIWTVNGETNTKQYFLKKYNISEANVLKRIERYNLTLEQAVSFPKVEGHRYGRDRRALPEQWKAMGLTWEGMDSCQMPKKANCTSKNA